MPSITHYYTENEWAEFEVEAKRQKRKLREFLRNSPLQIARAAQIVQSYQYLEHHQGRNAPTGTGEDGGL
jgi:hypothetical protein